jgi:hypothetical protein
MNKTTNTEFTAFKAVHGVLEPLDDDARSRVVKSVITLLSIDAQVEAEPEADIADEEAEAATEKAAQSAPTFSTFAELHAAANPTTNGDRALVAGYWLQVCQGSDNFTGQAANKELTHLGHKLSNVTVAINGLRKVKPQLILQIKKSGSSRQARKTYKVSHEGIRRVEEMIGG